MLALYTYSGCSTCRKATAFLTRHQIAFVEKPIREQPPTLKELSAMLGFIGTRSRLFNASGQEYRRLKMAQQLKTLSDLQALHVLAANGNLVKRPFVLMREGGLVGFKPEEWTAQLASMRKA